LEGKVGQPVHNLHSSHKIPGAWTENAIKRRIGLALLVGFLLKVIAAVCEPLATGHWDKKPQPTADRLSHYLNLRVNDFF